MKFTKPYWAGMIGGVGLGLMAGAALVELEWLAIGRKAWVSVVGILFFFVSLVMAQKVPSPLA